MQMELRIVSIQYWCVLMSRAPYQIQTGNRLLRRQMLYSLS